ncbi:hypothetical protein [Eudoraea sp.]|uniref:hypothetical protein n=1 Tax=Eudoraea sp. TaxID=1979955 RepID=UPI003C731B82
MTLIRNDINHSLLSIGSFVDEMNIDHFFPCKLYALHGSGLVRDVQVWGCPEGELS